MTWKAIAMLALLVAAAATPASGSTSPDGPAAGHYRIDPSASWIRVLVFRDGLLRRLGHNHVVSSSDLTGSVEVANPLSDSLVSLQLPLETLRVDDPAARDAEGERFPGTVPDDDIAATRNNMLGPRLLDAAASDSIRLRSTSVSGEPGVLTVAVEFELRGAVRQLRVPARVESGCDAKGNTLQARGEFPVTHEALGLTPFSAALGALRVRDELIVRYSIAAVREPGAEPASVTDYESCRSRHAASVHLP